MEKFRANEVDEKNLLHIGGGEYTGIIINRSSNEEPSLFIFSFYYYCC